MYNTCFFVDIERDRKDPAVFEMKVLLWKDIIQFRLHNLAKHHNEKVLEEVVESVRRFKGMESKVRDFAGQPVYYQAHTLLNIILINCKIECIPFLKVT